MNRQYGFTLVDANVAVVELEDLWKQYWHRGYEARDNVVVRN